MSQLPDRTVLATSAEYSPEERRELLGLARRAIHLRLRRETLDVAPPTPHLAQLRGAFTTLHLHGTLRGCIGYVLPVAPLYKTVIQTAAAAAFEDPRFEPVTDSEAPEVNIEISVMSPLFPITAEQIEIGTHGLLVSFEQRRGLLLPQVPVEHGWDVETFLRETCRKANLSPDAWRHGARLDAFTAEIFAD